MQIGVIVLVVGHEQLVLPRLGLLTTAVLSVNKDSCTLFIPVISRPGFHHLAATIAPLISGHLHSYSLCARSSRATDPRIYDYNPRYGPLWYVRCLTP